MGKRKTLLTETVKLRISPDEHVALSGKAAAAGLTVSAYVRRAILDSHVPSKAVMQEHTFLLANIANNLNQLAHHANRYRGSTDALRLAESVEALRADINSQAASMRLVRDPYPEFHSRPDQTRAARELREWRATALTEHLSDEEQAHR